MSKIKNILIFVAIGVVLVLVYIFFIKPAPEQAGLVSSTPATALPGADGSTTTSGVSIAAEDFLTLLLSVKNIKLDSSIFSDIAFNSLRDSSIVLVPDGTEGRPNPFAQFGNDNVRTTSTKIGRAHV